MLCCVSIAHAHLSRADDGLPHTNTHTHTYIVQNITNHHKIPYLKHWLNKKDERKTGQRNSCHPKNEQQQQQNQNTAKTAILNIFLPEVKWWQNKRKRDGEQVEREREWAENRISWWKMSIIFCFVLFQTRISCGCSFFYLNIDFLSPLCLFVSKRDLTKKTHFFRCILKCVKSW